MDSTSQDDSTSTNSFANLARAAHRVRSSGFGRQTRLMSLIPVSTSPVAPLQPDLSAQKC
eukprot:4395715-Pyramimonas_sp.AAC.1